MPSKRFKGKRYVYCGPGVSDTGGHVIARGFPLCLFGWTSGSKISV